MTWKKFGTIFALNENLKTLLNINTCTQNLDIFMLFCPLDLTLEIFSKKACFAKKKFGPTTFYSNLPICYTDISVISVTLCNIMSGGDKRPRWCNQRVWKGEVEQVPSRLRSEVPTAAALSASQKLCSRSWAACLYNQADATIATGERGQIWRKPTFASSAQQKLHSPTHTVLRQHKGRYQNEKKTE